MSRTAVVTGAAGGIGRATVTTLAGDGWEVIAVDRLPVSDWPETVRFRKVDVSQEAPVHDLFQELRETAGRLDALVNNAAEQISKPIQEMTVDEWDRTMASNLRSAFLTARAAHPLLAVAGGSLVNVASVHAVATSANIAAYAASKGGLVALTRALALEFAVDRIRVNAVLPGAVDTPMLEAGLVRIGGPESAASARRRLEQQTPLGRVAAPREIAEVIAFLIDPDRASFITGQSLIVDGGATARLATE